MKRDLGRPNADTSQLSDSDLITPNRSTEGSFSSTPYLEIIDAAEPTGSFRSIFDRVKNTLSPSLKRRTSDNVNTHEITTITVADLNKQPKNVSFAENTQNQIISHANHLAERILIETIEIFADKMSKTTNVDVSEENFHEDFHRTIQSQRITGENSEEEIYENLSTEIVAYVLKHALRTVKKEEELNRSSIERTDDDFIDLK